MAYTQAQLTTFFTNANTGTAPTAAQALALQAYATQSSSGQLTDQQALDAAIALGANSTSAVGVQTYAFFTGVAPSVAGLTALNAAYAASGAQANLNAENRFIAQSVALATQNTAAKAAFTTSYGSLTVQQATAAAYEIIIGTPAATAAGVNVANAVAYLTRAENVTYLTNFIKANTNLTAAADVDLAVKAAIIGQIMQAATSYNNGAGLGAYALATDKLLADLADDGNLVANNAAGINLFASYGSSGSAGGTPGTTTALKVGLDALVGTANDDTFIGTIDATGATATTVNLGDSIDGGAGVDTVNILSNVTGAVAVPAMTLKNVEALYVNNTITATPGTDIVTVNASGLGLSTVGTSGLGDVTVTNIGSAALGLSGIAYTATSAATVKAAGATKIALSGVTVATGGSVTVDVQTAAAADAPATLALTNTGAAATITTLKYGATGAAKTTGLSVAAGGNVTIGTLTSGSANELKTITVTGGGKFSVTNAVASNALTTITATDNTGGVTLSVDGTALTSVKGGSGADKITISGALLATAVIDLGAGNDTLALAAAPAAGATISGGAGDNTLSISASNVVTAANQAQFTNFQTLEVAGGAAAIAVDAASLTAFSKFSIGTTAQNVSFTNLAANPTINVTGAATGTTTLALASAAGTTDSVTLNLGVAGASPSAATVTKLTMAGVETLNLVSNNATAAGATTPAANTVTLDANVATNKVVVTGAGNLVLTTGASPSISIDASASTGAVNVTAAAATISNVIGTAKADTIVLSTAGGGAVNAGAGGDSIDMGAGGTSSTLILKAGDSILDVTTNAGSVGINGKGTMDIVTNFTTGTDKIDLTQVAFGAGSIRGVAEKSAADATTALTTLAAQADFFKDGGGLVRGVVDVTVGANHYVFVDTNKDGVFNAATDLVVQLNGAGGNIVETDIIWG